MLIAKLKTVAVGVLGVLLLGASVGALTYQGQAQGPGSAVGNGQPADGKVIGQPLGDAANGFRQGLVTAIDGNGLVQISLGTDDRVERGQMLDVYRLKPRPAYLGRLKVVEALGRSCVARPVVSVDGKKIAVGDQVTDELLRTPPGLGSAPGTEGAANRPLPAANPEGKVTRIDTKHHVIDVSLGGDDGIKEGQILNIYRLAPKAIFVGTVKVLVTYRQSAATRAVDVAVEARITVGDVVRATSPESVSGAAEGPAGNVEPPAAHAPPLDPRDTVELFLSAALAGKNEAARALVVPTQPKHVLEGVKALTKQPPLIAHIHADASEALVISEVFELKAGNEVHKGHYLVRLRSWAPTGSGSGVGNFTGGQANRWLVADLEACDAEETLTKLLDFLRRHPNARPLSGIPASARP